MPTQASSLSPLASVNSVNSVNTFRLEQLCLKISVSVYKFSFTQLIVSMKRIIFHRLKLCTFGDKLRVTGSRNMALDTDRTTAIARRFMTAMQYFLHFIGTSQGIGFRNVECRMLDVT